MDDVFTLQIRNMADIHRIQIKTSAMSKNDSCCPGNIIPVQKALKT